MEAVEPETAIVPKLFTSSFPECNVSRLCTSSFLVQTNAEQSNHGDVTASTGTRRRSSRDCSRARPASPPCRTPPPPLPAATRRRRLTSPPPTGALVGAGSCCLRFRVLSVPFGRTPAADTITSSESMIWPSRRGSRQRYYHSLSPVLVSRRHHHSPQHNLPPGLRSDARPHARHRPRVHEVPWPAGFLRPPKGRQLSPMKRTMHRTHPHPSYILGALIVCLRSTLTGAIPAMPNFHEEPVPSQLWLRKNNSFDVFLHATFPRTATFCPAFFTFFVERLLSISRASLSMID